MDRLEEIRERCEKIIISGLLDGDPYDDVKEYISALEDELGKTRRLAGENIYNVRSQTKRGDEWRTIAAEWQEKALKADAEIARLTTERDAAVADINQLLQQPGYMGVCWACKFYDGKPGCDKYNSNGDCCENAEWRVTQPERKDD